MEAAPPFEGVVLCGGRSSRMGRDKALVPVAGIAMARRAADALLTAGAARVSALGGDLAGLRAVGLEAVPDREPGEGPFPATVDAIERARHPIVLVVSCDLVSPSPETMRAVVRALGEHPAAHAAVPVDEGHHQWTHAAWRLTAGPILRTARISGLGSLRRGTAGLQVVDVVGLAGESLADADTPDQLPSDVDR